MHLILVCVVFFYVFFIKDKEIQYYRGIKIILGIIKFKINTTNHPLNTVNLQLHTNASIATTDGKNEVFVGIDSG